MSASKSHDDAALQRHLDHFDALYRADHDPWGARMSWVELQKRSAVERALGRQKLSKGVELGCGNGTTTRGLARHFQSLIAIEASPAAVALARAEAGDLPNVSIIEGVLPMTLSRGAYDAVIASEVLYYLPLAVLRDVLDMAKLALKPGGILVSANHVRRFSDSECTLEQLTLMTRRRFGRADYSLSYGAWRVDRFRRR